MKDSPGSMYSVSKGPGQENATLAVKARSRVPLGNEAPVSQPFLPVLGIQTCSAKEGQEAAGLQEPSEQFRWVNYRRLKHEHGAGVVTNHVI